MADNIQGFIKELAFEEALTHHLLDHGWNEVIKNPTEEQLVQNWADIIYDNNREIDKLGNYPLTASEMKQVMDQVNMKSSPYEMNRFINGKQVCIKRDNEADTNNFGKEVYLKIFDPMEISSGQSRYQIARQPKFKTADSMLGDRRWRTRLPRASGRRRPQRARAWGGSCPGLRPASGWLAHRARLCRLRAL